jgi:hypothetical protein
LSTLALSALLAGCGGGDDAGARVLPTLSPAASPSATATTGTGFTAASLEAAARNYYAVLRQALHTSDAALYATVVDPACPCYQRLAPKMTTRRAKGYVSRANADVLRVFDAVVDAPTVGRVSVVFKEEPATIVDSAGRVVETTSGTKPRQEVLKFQQREGRVVVVDIVDFGLVP